MAPKQRASTDSPQEKKSRRNETERNRSRDFRHAFDELRRSLTCVPVNLQAGTSKIQCLQLAMAYIAYLQAILKEPETDLSWLLSRRVATILDSRPCRAIPEGREQRMDNEATDQIGAWK